ncbi:uncharacterized protein DS421_15g513760 [Arachis hypogaea]|nr:uncharacterized protein DS421_15g513760 [Arachis hypogaea]
MPNKGNKTEATQPSKDNLRWSDEMDEALLNALAEEALKCNRHDGSWTTEAYANVVKTLSIAIGLHITKNHIKSRMKTLKDHFAEAYDLFHHLSGFAWNPVTRKFEADEKVWQDFIKELFGADRVTDIPIFSASLDSPSAPHGQPNQLGGNSTSRGTKRKSLMNDFLEAQYEKVALGITTMTDAVKEGSYLSSKLHDVAQRPRLYSESDVWDMLTELGLVGIPPEMRLDALFHFMTATGVRLGDMVLPENIHHYRNPNI